MTTVWQISQMERTLADGGVVVCHWRANASETVGTGDDAVTYSANELRHCWLHTRSFCFRLRSLRRASLKK